MPILLSLMIQLALCLPQEESSGSLQAFLARAQAKQAALQASLAPQLEPLLQELSLESTRAFKRDKLQQQVLALGSEVAPLLVPELEPSPAEDDQAQRRASQVTQILIKLKPGGVNRQLMGLAKSGSPGAQQRALAVLGHVRNPLGVDAFLSQTYRTGAPELRPVAIRAIAERKSAASLKLLREALGDPDAEIRQSAMRALAKAVDPEAKQAVLYAIQDPEAASSMGREAIAYFQAVPEAVDEDVVLALGQLAVETERQSLICLPILNALPNFPATRKSRELRRLLSSLKSSSQPEVRESALVCLHLSGDRTAKKELIRPYDENVKNDSRFYQAYTERGELNLRIREYTDAIKDFKQGLELINSDRSPAHKKAMLNLARAQCLAGKLSRAQGTLKELGLSLSERKELAKDPSFAALVESSRYGKLFQ